MRRRYWYTIPARDIEADPLMLASFVVVVAGAAEWLILAAPGFVATDGEYHGEDARVKPGQRLPEGLRDELKAEAARLGADANFTDYFWVKG